MMPTYTYTSGNKQATSEVQLSEADLLEVFGGDVGPKDSLVAESLRKGVASGFATMAGAAGAANELVSGRPLNMIGGFKKHYAPVEQVIMGMLGSTGVKPSTQSEQIMAGAIQGLSDPTSYLFGPAKYLKDAPTAIRLGYQALQGVAGGAGGEAGGIVGEKVGGDAGRVAGSLIGGATGGVVAGATPRVGAAAVPFAVNKTKALIARIRGTEPLEEAEKLAQNHINKIFVAAASADPNFVDVLEQSIKAQEATGIKMPLSALMKDNPVLNSYIAHLAAVDPEFKKQFTSQFDLAKVQMGGKADKLFGVASSADDNLAISMKQKANDFKKLSVSATKRAAQSQQMASDVALDLDKVNPHDFGARVVDITDAAEKNARKAVSPSYKAAFDIAKERGIELPDGAVQDIYDTVVTSKNSDVFYTFPNIFNKVKNRFAPKTKEASGLLDASGNPIGKESKVFSAASIEDLDSLKQEINRSIRKSREPKEIRVLEDLKSRLNGHIEDLDAEFVDAYKSADKQYLMKVGLPFNEETIKSIGRAKFNENVIPLLTRNKSTTSQFISATGEPGKKLVEDAFVSDFAKFTVKDGVIDQAKAKAWFSSRADQLTVTPDIKASLEKMARNSDALMGRVKNIQTALDDASKSRILKAVGVNAQEIVNRMYSSKSFTDDFVKQYGNDKDAMNAARSFLLDDIIKSSNPIDVLNDRTRAGVYDKVFGSAYKDAVKNIAIVSDRMTKNPSAVAVNFKGIDADMLTNMIGMKPERITSLFMTNPVVSKPVAIMTVLNRFFNKKAGEIVERDMKQLLLDREGGVRLLHSLKVAKNGGVDLDRLNAFAKWAESKGIDFTKMLKDDAAAGAVRSYRGATEEELNLEEYTQ